MQKKTINGRVFIKNEAGDWIPEAGLKPIKIKSSQLTEKLCKMAASHRTSLERFKKAAYTEVYDHLIKLGEANKTVIDSSRGITITSIDMQYKVQIAFSQYLVADEQVEVARQKMAAIIAEQLKSHPNMSTFLSNLFNKAFEMDSQGRLDAKELIRLAGYRDEEVPGWNDACDLLMDSITTTHGKKYIRFYEKTPDGCWKQIVLNFSSL